MSDNILTFVPDELRNLETLHCTSLSARILIRPGFDLGEGESASFRNPADNVMQKLNIADGVIIAPFVYPVKAQDFNVKSSEFKVRVDAAVAHAANLQELVAGLSAIYSDMGLGTPDLYCSTRAEMVERGSEKARGLQGVSDIDKKEAVVELLRIKGPKDSTVGLKRASKNRDEIQSHHEEMVVQIEARGKSRERYTAIQPHFVAANFVDASGKLIKPEKIPTYSTEQIRPEGVSAGTAAAQSPPPPEQVIQ